MDWTQIWTVLGTVSGLFVMSIGATITLFIWNRAENRADYRHIQNMLESNRKLIDEIRLETKDFHGRLCSLEEKYINWMMRKKNNDD